MGLRRWRSADDPQRTLDREGTVTQGLGDARPPPDAQGGEQAVTQGCQSLGRVPFGCLAVVFAQGLITHIVHRVLDGPVVTPFSWAVVTSAWFGLVGA